MWQGLWQDKAEDDVPITSVTNGVHTLSWLARRITELYKRTFGPDWINHIDDPRCGKASKE